MRNLLISAAIASLMYTAAHADSWPGAVESGTASRDGRIVVRVIPGDSLGEVYGFAGAEKGRHATAHYYRLSGPDSFVKYQEVELLNPVAPVFHAVAGNGAFVTLDNWHNMGYGNVITVYSATGEITRSYTLADIYRREQIATLPTSVSSIWWRCPEAPALAAFGNRLRIHDVLKQVIEVDLETGAIEVTARHEGCSDDG